MGRKKRTEIIEKGSLVKGLLILSAPLMLSNLLKALHDFIDTFFLGGVEGSAAAQAAIAVSSPLAMTLLAVPAGLAIGIIATVSHSLGENDKQGAKRLMGISFTVGLILSVALTVLSYFACPLILGAFSEGEPLRLAREYIRLRSFELPAAVLFEIYRGQRQAQGDTVNPLLYSLITVGLNITLTATAVYLGFGIRGAAAATVVSQWTVIPIILIAFFRSKKYLTINLKEMALEKKRTLRLLKISLPTAVSGALAAIGFLFLQYFVRNFGNETVAAFSVCNRITNILTVPISALAGVLVTFIGQNEGTGNRQRSIKAYKVSRNAAVILMAAFAVCIYFVRAPIIAAVSNNEEVRAAAAEYLVWALAALPLLGLFQNYCGAYNGYGKTGYTFILESARLWGLRLPLVFLLTVIIPLGRSGIWYGMMISNILICVLGFILLKICRGKRQKYKKKPA